MHWTLPEWFIEERNALTTSDIHWQMELQQEKYQLENDKRVLQGQVDRLTKTTERQAETIEILVKKLAELGVEVRYRTSGSGVQAHGDD